MKVWVYVEPGPNNEPVRVAATEEEILARCWDYWVREMIRAGKLLMVTEENCITDYVVVNWCFPEE